METKSVKDRFRKTKLEYLNNKPLLNQGSLDLDQDWVNLVLDGKDTSDPSLLFLKDKGDLPTRKNILVLFHFFRSLDQTSSKSIIADRVYTQVMKYWIRSNIPTQKEFWI